MTDRHEADKQLAAAICTGDRAAFDRFFRDYFPRLFRFAFSRLSGDSDLAKDMVQQAMIKAIHSLSDYRGEAALFTWLCQVCRSEISAHRRKQSRRGRVVVSINSDQQQSAVEAVADDPALEPERQTERGERIRTIHDLLDSLPCPYGEALEMKYVEGCSVEDIAERLGTGTTAVQSMLARARRAFKQAAEAAGLSAEL